VPMRGNLGPEQLQSIVEMYPKYKDAIEALGIQRRNILDQIKGRKNLGVPPEFAPHIKEFLGKANLHPSQRYESSAIDDLAKSGVMANNGSADVITIQELLTAGLPPGPHDYSRLQAKDIVELLGPGRKEMTSEETRMMANYIDKLRPYK